MTYKPVFSRSDVEIVARETAFQGFFSVQRLTLRHRLYKGGWSESFTRELFCRGRAAGVLLHDPKRDQLVLVEQFRVGQIDETDRAPWALELVAGMLDANESIEQMAMREVQEETGLSISNLRFICDYYNSPGGSDERISVFYAQVDAANAGGVFGLDEEHEDIKVVVLSVSEAIDLLSQGVIDNAMAIIALQWLQLHHSSLLSGGNEVSGSE